MDFKAHIPKVIAGIFIIAALAISFFSSINEAPINGEPENISIGQNYSKYAENISAGNMSVLYTIAAAHRNPRVAPLFVFGLILLVLYLWSRKLLGEWWALMPLALASFSPAFLAYGHYVTIEIAAAFATLIFGWAKSDIILTRKLNWANGLVLAIAAAFYSRSAILISIIVIALILIITAIKHLKAGGRGRTQKIWLGAGLALLAFMIVAGFFVWAVAVIQTDYQTASWTNGTLEMLQHYSLKESIPSLIILGLALIYAISKIAARLKNWQRNFADFIGANTEEFIMILFCASYFAVWPLINSDFGIGSLIPILPFIYIIVSSGIKNFVKGGLWNRRVKIGIVITLILWHGVNAWSAYPNYLSYVNEGTAAYPEPKN